jgi:hypothetical protein
MSGMALLAFDARHAREATARHLADLSDEALVALLARSGDDALAELYDRFGLVAWTERSGQWRPLVAAPGNGCAPGVASRAEGERFELSTGQ